MNVDEIFYNGSTVAEEVIISWYSLNTATARQQGRLQMAITWPYLVPLNIMHLPLIMVTYAKSLKVSMKRRDPSLLHMFINYNMHSICFPLFQCHQLTEDPHNVFTLILVFYCWWLSVHRAFKWFIPIFFRTASPALGKSYDCSSDYGKTAPVSGR